MAAFLLGLLLGLGLGGLLAALRRSRQRPRRSLRQRVRRLLQRMRERERQRLVREIHDGMGAHLVGLLHMVERPRWPRALVTEQLQQVVDEMRLAIDALQPEGDELALVLAQLRHRLGPRLEAAGLRLEWAVDELPPWPLGAAAARDLQRLLLEGFTNVLKHAQASQVRVEAAVHEASLVLRLSDDGVGLGVRSGAQGNGLGLPSMQARALRLGGVLDLLPVSPQGLCVSLRLPLPLPAG